MSYFQNFPNTNFYNQDLGWLIKKYKELNGDVKILQQIYDMIKEQIKDITIDQLQEWLDDGTIENLIRNVFGFFNTTQEMIESAPIKGCICKTMGYYAVDDKGGNYWIITDIQPDTFYVLLSNGLYAKKINTGINNIMQFGVKADLEEPQQTVIQKAIDDSEVLYFNEGVYFVNLASPYSLNCHDNLKIIGDNTTIKGIGSYDNNFYTVIAVASKNVTIENIKIDGAKELVTVVGEHGMGTTVEGQNVLFRNVEFQNCFGDGAIIDKESKNIVFDSCYFHDCRRQGISICGCNGVKITNCIIENISGTAPSDGIDIEPYNDIEVTNIIIENTKISNCAGFGIQCYLETITSNLNTTITVDNIEIENCSCGLHYSYMNQGVIVSNKNIFLSNMADNFIVVRSIPSGKKEFRFENITIFGNIDNAIVIDGSTSKVEGIVFDGIKAVTVEAPFNRKTVNFLTNAGVEDIVFINTNIDRFINWNLVKNLIIKNNPLILNTDTNLNFTDGTFYSDIYIDSNVSLTWGTIYGNADIQSPAPEIKVIMINNWNCNIINSYFNKNSDKIGTTGIKITDNEDGIRSGGSSLIIQPIRNLMCIKEIYGNWKARD